MRVLHSPPDDKLNTNDESKKKNYLDRMPSKQTDFVKNLALKNSRSKEEKNTGINDVNTINKEEEKIIWEYAEAL